MKIILRLLIIVLVLELLLGGGGRVFDLGITTLRMLAFSLLLAFGYFYILVTKKVSNVTVFFVLLCLISLLVSCIVSESSLSVIAPFLFFLLLPIVYKFPVEFGSIFVKQVPYAALVLSSSYLFFLLLISVGSISPFDIYNYIPESEIFFRGSSGFVYKGFLFISLGLFYFVVFDNINRVSRLILSSICVLSLLLTLTRGLWLSTFLVVMLYYFFLSNISWTKKVLLLFLVIFLLSSIVVYYSEYFFREGSDNVRINDFLFLIDFYDNNPETIIFGNGIESNIGHRPQVENSYLDIAYRFGLFGLVLFLVPLLVSILSYINIVNIAKLPSVISLSKFLLMSIIFIYILSVFNPYINNYIGGTSILIISVYITFLWKSYCVS